MAKSTREDYMSVPESAVPCCKVSVEADVERQVTEPSVSKILTEFKPETKPAARTQLTSTESPASTTTPSQETELFPSQLSTVALQTQDTTLQIKPAKTEACPEQGMANPSTKDFKAIISATKEPSTASVPFTDQPREVSLPQPSSMDVVMASFLETAPKELNKERGEGIFHRNLAETVKPSASSTSEEMDTTPESKPNLSFPSLSSEEKPLKTSVERLAEMVSSPSHSSPLLRGTSPREPPQMQILPSLGEHSSVIPTTTLIPLTPKIGMGKPAITKRKFSPGRPRVKQ
ncbi:histone-lysine N-methyltransferase 2C-like isoform X8, partial [Lates japonicus]